MPTQDSLLERAIRGFSYAVAAVGALLSLPFFNAQFRFDVYHYLNTSFDMDWSYWGSWAFVLFMGAICFFGIGLALQLLVQLLFRGLPRRDRM